MVKKKSPNQPAGAKVQRIMDGKGFLVEGKTWTVFLTAREGAPPLGGVITVEGKGHELQLNIDEKGERLRVRLA
jgi:hypothetical protein